MIYRIDKICRAAACVTVCLLAVACARGPQPPVRSQRVVYGEQSARDRAMRTVEGRAIWVPRWSYRTPEDVRLIVDNCARVGFNIVFFQVRGNATAFYRSAIEPWAWELTSSGTATTGRDPGFDPLAVAIEQANLRRVELHAYMNVFPGWMGETPPPPEAGQLWTRHPEWFMVGRDGQKMAPRVSGTGGSVRQWYSFLNPARPDVQDYVVSVFREVAERYDVDGIHLDYVRYPSEVGDFSYDETSLRRFREETGKTPDDAPDLWVRWRGKQVSEVVRRIYDECKKAKSHLVISASVGRDPNTAREKLMQPALEWMAAGKLDVACPMIYTSEAEVVARCVTEYVSRSSGRLVLAGLMAPGRNRQAPTKRAASIRAVQLIEQIRIAQLAGAEGISVFSYGALFPDHKPNEVAKALTERPFRNKARVPLP
ncbi:family 10 glycosylhydrolase [Candidatus Sumerlaeota bacterium]|nr:family 10 glycosylhydrolase [Candidatus Sumerlaeota bacterium]